MMMKENYLYLPCELFDSLREPLILLSDSFTFQYVNKSFSNLVGKHKDDIEGFSITTLFKPSDLARLLPELKRALGGEKFSTYLHFQQNDEFIKYRLDFFPRLAENKTVNDIIISFSRQVSENSDDCIAKNNTEQKPGKSDKNPDLQEIEKMFDIITEYSNDLIYMTDMEQNFIFFSPSVERVLGYSLPEAYNLHVKDIMTKESFDYQLDLFNKHLEYYSDDLSRVQAIDRVELVRKDGTRFWSETNASLILDEHNKPAGIFGISRDISAQKEREQSLKEKSEYYKILAEYAADLIFMIDIEEEQKINYISPSVKNILGYSEDEVYSLSVRDVLTKESYDYQKQILKERLKKSPGYSTVTKTIELQLVHKDGRKIWGESHARLIANDHGEPMEIIGIIRDINDRKNAEEKDKKYQRDLLWLSQSATKFLTLETEDAIYDYIGKTLSYWIENAVFVVNKVNESNDTVTVKNVYGISNNTLNKAINILGINPVGRSYPFVDNLKNLYRQNRIVKFEGGLNDFSFGYFSGFLLKQIERVFGIEQIYTIGLKRHNHWYAIIHIFKTKTPELNEKNLLETFLNQASIVLQRKQIEQQWLRAKEEAEQSNRLKTAFLSNMSHEIRSPLNIIMGYSQMLEDHSISPDEKMNYIDSIKNSSEKLMHVIDDIILISKIETGQLELEKETFNMNDLLNNIFYEYNELANEKGNKLEFEGEGNSNDCNVYSDFNKVKQIIDKLLDNAIKFTDSGKISLGFKKKGSYFQFKVSDTGQGIPFELKEKVFDNFYQVDHLNTRKFEGTGLGLSISKSLVRTLGGDIWVDSENGQGTTVFFTVPVEEPS